MAKLLTRLLLLWLYCFSTDFVLLGYSILGSVQWPYSVVSFCDMNLEIFAQGLQTLVSKCSLFPNQDLEAVAIINPTAGCFVRPAKAASAMQDMDAAIKNAADIPVRTGTLAFRLYLTNAAKHASKMAEDLIDEAAMKPDSSWLVILASGDGTSLEFLDELSRAPEDIRGRFTVLRLPMGTGNDGSDGRELSDSLSRLTGQGKLAVQQAIRVIPAAGSPASRRAANGEWRAFNIASIGMDAYITHMTNKLKTSFPGDSYKLWVDIATLFYDKVYPPKQMTIKAMDSSGSILAEHEGLFLLMAMGISGNRTYGSNIPILPSNDNVCAIRQMPLFKKLVLKGPLLKGRVEEIKEAIIFSADNIEIDYQNSILVQMDGEAELLNAEDFPLRLEKTGPVIRYIARL